MKRINNKVQSRFLLRRVFKYTSPIFRPFENIAIKKHKSTRSISAPVFILGLPRSGSTFLYQFITDCFDVLFIDNLMNLGRENLFLSKKLSYKLFKDTSHKCYDSKFGNTDFGGLHAPSESGQFWYRWLPRNAIVLKKNDISEKSKNEIRSVINSIINKYHKPFVIKNLFSVLRIDLLQEIFPNAKFIIIHRKPEFIAQSIYLARKANTLDFQSQWWSVPIPDYESMLDKPVEVQIAHQVATLNRILGASVLALDKKNYIEIDYEDIDIGTLMDDIKNFLSVDIRTDFEKEEVSFSVKNDIKISDEMFNKLSDALIKI